MMPPAISTDDTRSCVVAEQLPALLCFSQERKQISLSHPTHRMMSWQSWIDKHPWLPFLSKKKPYLDILSKTIGGHSSTSKLSLCENRRTQKGKVVILGTDFARDVKLLRVHVGNLACFENMPFSHHSKSIYLDLQLSYICRAHVCF